jgi:cation diffusion facilitator CzcD-associated flavoprotein CzcO
MPSPPVARGALHGAPEQSLDALIVGAGFSGIYMLHRLRALGLSVRVIEAGPSVGGTWYWNRYPGARVDVRSSTYSYSFSDALEREWRWTERYAAQREILRYINHVVDRFDLRRDMQFDTRVTAARYDEPTRSWRVDTDRGDRFGARFAVMATGCLSMPRIPAVEGLESFSGDWYHTADWPEQGLDLSGRRVGVIGTGSSAIQAIPVIAAQAAHLTVFQRTANFSIPAWNGPVDDAAEAERIASYPARRAIARVTPTGDTWEVSERPALALTAQEREREYERRWQEGGFSFLTAFADILTDVGANETAAEFVRRKIRERVHDPATAELLCPKDHPFGTKRMCVDTNYYETYNRDNVTLVDVASAPIEAIMPGGVRTSAGVYDLNTIVFATGFDAMTGALLAIDIRGRDGVSLAQRWAAGPRTQLGVASAGFPNLFFITGPGSPSVLSNMMTSIEQHVDWVADCIGYLCAHGFVTIEPEREAEERWVDHVAAEGAKTLYPRANSWYVGANIPGKPRVLTPYTGGVGAYRALCERTAAAGYEGFALAR